MSADEAGVVTGVEAEFIPDGNYKKKKMMTWLAKSETLIPVNS